MVEMYLIYARHAADRPWAFRGMHSSEEGATLAVAELKRNGAAQVAAAPWSGTAQMRQIPPSLPKEWQEGEELP